MSQFERPSGAYAGAAGLPNRTKYQDDAVAVPKQPISSSKMDGEFNYLVDGLNTLAEARGSKATIAERLDVNLNADGTFKASVVAGLDDWIAHTVPTTLTRVSDTSVSLTGGDYRSLYPVNRRVKLVVGGLPFYADVASASYLSNVTTLGLAGIVDGSGVSAVIASTPTSVAYGPLVPGATGNTPLRAERLVVADYALEANAGSLKIAPVAGGTGVTIAAGGLTGVATGAVDFAALTAGLLQRLVPVGTVLPFAGSAAPTGYLLCAGQAVSRTTYADLFTVLSTTYGTGDGTTTFNLPDLRGRSVFGKDDMGGTAANRVTNAVSGVTANTLGAVGGSQAMQQHTHTVTDAGHVHGQSLGYSSNTQKMVGTSATGTSVSGAYMISGVGNTTLPQVLTDSATTGITLANTGAGTSQNMPPVLVLNWMIRA